MPAKKGDTIRISPFSEWKQHPVTWTQDSKSREEVYYLADYEDVTQKSSPEDSNKIYIASSSLDSFKQLSSDSSEEVTVTDAFQYGQAKNYIHRFLVYHDKSANKPRQHDFVQGAAIHLANKGEEGGYPRDVDVFVRGQGYEKTENAKEVDEGFVGSGLNDF